MADSVNSVPAVYDLAYPSPIPLKEISSIVVIVELWRREIDAYLESNDSNKFNLTRHIQLKNLIPGMPSIIHNQLSNYIDMYRTSIEKWLQYHCYKVFMLRNDDEDSSFNSLLSRFHDFAWDWNGAINYDRTAKRMLQCDRFSLEEKFRIACQYCFKDDIKRIFPSVSTKIQWSRIFVYESPLLVYWMMQLEIIPYAHEDDLVIIDLLITPHNHSSLHYFWNEDDIERRWRRTDLKQIKYVDIFARFILQQLDERQLGEFLTNSAFGMMFNILMCDLGRCCVLSTWMYIRDKIYKDDFRVLIMDLLSAEVEGDLVEESLKLCREIWYSAPSHCKQAVFNDLLLKEPKFLRLSSRIERSKPKQMKLLITVLHDVTMEERSAFWLKHWRTLVRGAVIEDLLEMMKLCFRDEHEIRSFKDDIMCQYENIEYYRISSLKQGRIDKLNDYLDFCCPDEQKRRQLKQRFLREDFVSKVNSDDFRLYEFKTLNEFIDDAFERNDVRVEFKNQLISSPKTEQFLLSLIREGEFALFMEFVGTFVSEQPPQPVIVSLKTSLHDYFRKQLIAGAFGSIHFINTDNLQRFLIWLLGNEDEVTSFKQSLPVDDIFRNIVQSKLRKRRYRYSGDGEKPNKLPKKLHYFPIWYFNQDDEKIASFKQRFSDELKVFVPLS